jgi:hypothetical protein
MTEPATVKRISPMTVIYPAEAVGLSRVLSAQDVRVDHREVLRETYQQIFDGICSWDDQCQPRLLPDDEAGEISVEMKRNTFTWPGRLGVTGYTVGTLQRRHSSRRS